MYTLGDAGGLSLRESEGKKIMLLTEKGRPRVATVRLKKVKCGKKNCTKCPHTIYAYAQYREGKKIKTKYLGVAR